MTHQKAKKQKNQNVSPNNAFDISGKKKNKSSPLNEHVWRCALLITTGSLIVWLIRTLSGFEHAVSLWLAALIALATWICAIRMLLLDSKFKKFWIAWLCLSLILVVIFSSNLGIWIAAQAFAFVFLLIRLYKPYRHLTSRRRAALYLIGFIVFCLLSLGWIPGKTTEIGVHAETLPQTEDFLPSNSQPFSFMDLGRHLANYSIWSLRFFWLFSILHIFLNIRLHFMKLKPKLAVSAILIAFIPLLLVNVMGGLTIYSTLGASRATRAKAILKDWASLAAVDDTFIGMISNSSFTYVSDGVNIQKEEKTPPWFSGFLQALQTDMSRVKEWSQSRHAQFFWIGSDIWLIRFGDIALPSMDIKGCLLDSTMMNRLAGILQSDVKLSFSNPIDIGISRDVLIRSVPKGEKPSQKEIHGKYQTEPGEKSASQTTKVTLWRKTLYFGMTDVDVVSFSEEKFQDQKILLMTESSLFSIVQALFSEQNPLSLLVMSVLLALFVILLILEAFALFFGIRIAGGITSAVKALHQGTRQIAKGDFDIQIDIPNEDELGDLAVSFNEMAAAVKIGQEEAIERERLERELETAREIQEKLLPHEMPIVSGFEITGTSLPSQQVGGDYFDFLDIGNGQLGVAIADVSGKGIPAALLMANLQASLHAQIFQPGEVAEVAYRINNLLYRSTDAHMFVTFFYGILDRQKSIFTSTNAGHNQPLLFRSDGRIERLREGGLILGFQPDVHYDQQTVTIRPGEVIVLYTDGITEAADPSSEMVTDDLFGVERLVEVIRANLDRSAREIQSAILEAIARHTSNAPQYDDITLVVIKRND
jgi:serine phosphatase RsbU (regulator of sigma subunit)